MASSTACMGWTGLGLLLYFYTFGLLYGTIIVCYVVSFLLGGLTIAYYYGKRQSEVLIQHGSPSFGYPSTGIPQLVKQVKNTQPVPKVDKRLTGSKEIDEVLIDVLDKAFRDYIEVWYKTISDHQGFHYDIRLTIQKAVIAFSSKCKEADWVQYFTTRLFEDFAMHLRLFRKSQKKIAGKKKDDPSCEPDLLSIFFDLEAEMEKNKCHDLVCMNRDKEIQYLQDISETLLFLLLPPEDFHNKPFRYICRDVMVNGIFIPTVDLLADPDYINQYIAWMCKDDSLTKESFLAVIKCSDSVDEMNATLEKVRHDISKQRSKDTGGGDNNEIKQQLNSLKYVEATCEKVLKRLQGDLDEADGPNNALGAEYSHYLNQNLPELSFDEILNSNLGLAAFMEFLTAIGAQGYINFYLNMEAYRVSAEQQITEARVALDNDAADSVYEMLQQAAFSFYDQYLGHSATYPLELDDKVKRKTLSRMKEMPIEADVFEETRVAVYNKLQEDQYFGEFKKSTGYVKLLMEMDLLGKDNDSEMGIAIDEDTVIEEDVVDEGEVDVDAEEEEEEDVKAEEEEEFMLSVDIKDQAVMKEDNKQYALYVIQVTKVFTAQTDKDPEIWDTYRRYSDFHDLHMTITEKYSDLASLKLPEKKTFNNMKEEFLNKRRKELNKYLQMLLQPDVLKNHEGLLKLVSQFLKQGEWEKGRSDMARKMDSFVNPFKTSMRNMGNVVKSVPENFVDGVQKVTSLPRDFVDGMGKIFGSKGNSKSDLDSGRMAGIDAVDGASASENIPLRIMLLLMDEVFDLRSKNQWLRKQIVAILQQIIKATFGDKINRKIVDHVDFMTSAKQVADYITQFRDAFWPEGRLAKPRAERKHNDKMRMRVMCKTKMLGSVSDEMRHLIGSDTTRKGVIRVFEMFQQETLNRRLFYVTMEGVLQTLFPENKFHEIFDKIHSKSTRMRSGTGGEKADSMK